MVALFIDVHSWDEKIGQTEDERGNLEHYWTAGKSKYHNHMWYSFGLGCQEHNCEMNDPSTDIYQQLRRLGF